MFRQLFAKTQQEEIRESEEKKQEREELREIIGEQERFEVERPEPKEEDENNQEVEVEGEGEEVNRDNELEEEADELKSAEEEEGGNDTNVIEETSESKDTIKVKIGDTEEEFTKEEVEKILEGVFLNEESEHIGEEAKAKLSIVDNLTLEQLKTVADALNGNSEAQKALIKALGIDPYEIDLEKEVDYSPNIDEFKTDSVQSFIEDISKREPKIASEIVDTYNSLPEDAQREFYDVRALRIMRDYAKQGTLKNIVIKAKAKKKINQYLGWAEAFAVAEQEVIKKENKANKEVKNIKGRKTNKKNEAKNPYLLSTKELKKEIYSMLERED